MNNTEESGAISIPAGVACGKVILLGEHAVVYGVPAIAVGIEHGVRADARRSSAGRAGSPFGRGTSRSSERGRSRDLGSALAPPPARRADATRRWRIDAQVDLPPGGGLGCSAALGVAVARAIDPSAKVEAITERVMAWERVFHGNPSGIDAACAARGGCIAFTQGGGGAPHQIEAVHAGASLTVCIGNSGVASSTKTMVEAVARLRERRPRSYTRPSKGFGRS